MKNHMSFEAPSTSRLAIVHDFKLPVKWQDRVQFGQTSFAKSVHELLAPQSLLVEIHHTIDDIERIFSIQGFGTSLLLGIKSLMGKTLVYHNGHIHIQESGTKFAVRSVMSVSTQHQQTTDLIDGIQGRFAALIEKSVGHAAAANDTSATLAA